MNIQKLSNKKEILSVATFFSNKWGIPLQAYIDSMQESLKSNTGVPAWYYIKDKGNIIAGFGIIENDFHKRKDLTPNICALYVTEPYQHKGIAKKLLNHACLELQNHNIQDVYLITTHDKFYERCGFSFYGEIEEDDGSIIRCYHKKTKENALEK